MVDVLSDERVKWIRQRVCLSLDIGTEAFDSYFTTTLERARTAEIAKETLLEYLGPKCGSGSALFFASQSWVEEVQGQWCRFHFCFDVLPLSL